MKMLRELRKANKMTMKELGSLVGVSESCISQYETGKREADYEMQLKLAEALDTTVDYLLRGVQSQFSAELGWLVSAYKNAPAEVRRIVDAALEPYRLPSQEQRAI